MVKEMVMKEKEQSGIFRKILSGFKKDSCCAVEVEEVPENTTNSGKETAGRQSEEGHESDQKCGCCCS